MKYQIKYYYRTGDSFGSEDREEILELEFNDIKIAEANLDRINEHYKQYEKLNSYSNRRDKSEQELLEQNQNKDWFVKEMKLVAYKEGADKNEYHAIDENQKKRAIKEGYLTRYIIDSSNAQNCIILYTDEGKPYQIWAPWCGYFETLYSVEIVAKPMKKYEF